MKHVLNGNLKVWHLLIFAIGLMIFGGAASVLADTSGINALWRAGEIRLAAASADDSNTIDISGTGTQKIVLSTTINIPEGKTADLQTTFSADLHHNSGTFAYCFGEFGLDTSVPDTKFKPGSYQLLGGDTAHEPATVTVSMTGYRKSIGSGTHTINVYVNAAYAGCTLFARNLNVIASIR